MKQILVISGKGGTGKTVVSGCFAVLAENKVIVDADVDAANLHLLLNPKIKEEHDFIGGKIARIDKEKCIECGACREVCRFDSITEDFEIIPVYCEGCTICWYFCEQGAIVLEDRISGKYYISETKYGDFVHARLGIAQENSGKLVAHLREVAKEIANEKGRDYIIIDGPPGVGCPVMASMTGVDVAVVVTEPTLSGLHDLERVVQLAKHFKVELKVVINKFDLNPEVSQKIESYLEENQLELAGKIPFSRDVLESVKLGKPFIEYARETNKGEEVVKVLEEVWEKVR